MLPRMSLLLSEESYVSRLNYPLSSQQHPLSNQQPFHLGFSFGVGEPSSCSFSSSSISTTTTTSSNNSSNNSINNGYLSHLIPSSSFATTNTSSCTILPHKKILSSSTDAIKPTNHRRFDRYNDVKPFDFNRVPISRNAGYINASYIDGVSGSREYIATQAPLKNTFCGFWEMVLRHESPAVVMLTDLLENGVRKADRYWPSPSNPVLQFDDMTVSLENFTSHQDLEISHLKVSDGVKSWHTTHFFQSGWADRTADISCDSFDRLISSVRDLKKNTEQQRHHHHPSEMHCNPIVVHCSAGLGRSGTFIAINILLDRHLKGQQPLTLSGAPSSPSLAISVEEVVSSLRSQRKGMVQTKSQYVFISSFLLSRGIPVVADLSSM